MKLSSTLAGLAIAGAVSVGTAGIAFGADGGSSTTTPTPDKQTAHHGALRQGPRSGTEDHGAIGQAERAANEAQ